MSCGGKRTSGTGAIVGANGKLFPFGGGMSSGLGKLTPGPFGGTGLGFGFGLEGPGGDGGPG